MIAGPLIPISNLTLNISHKIDIVDMLADISHSELFSSPFENYNNKRQFISLLVSMVRDHGMGG